MADDGFLRVEWTAQGSRRAAAYVNARWWESATQEQQNAWMLKAEATLVQRETNAREAVKRSLAEAGL